MHSKEDIPPSSSSSSSIDSKSGFCSETKIYHSLRPPAPLPRDSFPLSITDYVFSFLRRNLSPPPPGFGDATCFPPSLIDAATRLSIRYSDLEARVRNLSAFLRHRVNLSKGDSAFVLSPNSVHLPVLYLSLFSLGVIVCPSNPASSISEISHQIQLSKPVIAFVSGDAAPKLRRLRHRSIVLDSPEFESITTTKPTEHVALTGVFQSDTAAILFSSGTTGRIKGVVLTQRNFIASIAGAIASKPARASPAVSLCAVPYFHVYGFGYCVRCVAFGESVASMARFDLGVTMKAVEEFRVTHLAAAPPVVVRMLNTKDEVVKGFDLTSLEMVISGGAPLTNAAIEKFGRRFPTVPLVQSYGLTETTGAASRLAGLDEFKVAGTVGRLISNCQANIVDPRTGVHLPPFEQGELLLRGPIIMKGYVDDTEGTATALDSQGWLRTGDLCYFDNRGFLFCVDRLKELIKYKGYQVPPTELEQILQSHPNIVEAAVIPYPDEEAGQVPMAYVVRRPGSIIDEPQVVDFVAKQVAPYKRIRRVSFIDSIPKNAPGKVLRKELMKLALSSSVSKL